MRVLFELSVTSLEFLITFYYSDNLLTVDLFSINFKKVNRNSGNTSINHEYMQFFDQSTKANSTVSKLVE